MEDIYSKKVKDHFLNPRNVGEIKNADGVGTVGNPTCGDVMTVYIEVKTDKIKNIKFISIHAQSIYLPLIARVVSWNQPWR